MAKPSSSKKRKTEASLEEEDGNRRRRSVSCEEVHLIQHWRQEKNEETETKASAVAEKHVKAKKLQKKT